MFKNNYNLTIKFNYSSTITVPNTGTAAPPNNRNNEVVFKNWAPFTDCISEINNMQIVNAKEIDVVMNMYNLIEI